MKPELQRIEAALQAAANQYVDRLPEPIYDWMGAIALETTGDVPQPTTSGVQSSHSELVLPPPQVEQRPALPEFAATLDHQPFVALTNSALAINLLKDLQNQVQGWMVSLDTVLKQIQAVYTEGPLVDGWLESVSTEPSNTAMYRLCGLGEDGQVWSRLCPPAQVPDVSMAIVRYQRLQTLLTQKHRLESQLGVLTESLVELHGKLAEPNPS